MDSKTAPTIDTVERYPTHQIYTVNFHNDVVETTVTHDPNQVTPWITKFSSAYFRIFGLKIQHKSTLNICINDRCLIFQLTHSSYFPDALVKFLTNHAHTFVGVGIKSDIEKLEKEYGIIGKNVRIVDLGDAAVVKYGRRELKGYGLKSLCEFVLGKTLEKPGWFDISAWNRKRLTAHQVMFSCVDGLVCYHIGVQLRADTLDYRALLELDRETELPTKESASTTIEAVERHPTYQVYNVDFFDDGVQTTVTHDPNKVTEWISKFESTYQYFFPEHLLIFGLDIEWRPGKNPIAILQICINDRCLIFQIIHAPSIPDSLKKFLANPAHTFFGVGIKSDIEKLNREYGIGRNAKAVDLSHAAAVRYGKNELKGKGLKYLCKYVLGKDMDKPEKVRTSAWDNRRLSDEQVMYACVDVLVCYNIGGELRADKLDKHWKPPAPHIDDHTSPGCIRNLSAVLFHESDRPSCCCSCHSEEFSTKPNPQKHETPGMDSVVTKIYNVMWFNKPIKTTVTNDPSQVTKWISDVQSIPHDRLIFGFDVEWRPAFASGHQNPIATLQICINDRCLIFQIIHSPDVPYSLSHFLANPAYTFVGGDVDLDLLKLNEDYQIGRRTNTVDAGDLALHRYGNLDLKYCGLKKIYRHVFGKEMQNAPSVSSEWDSQMLSTDQVKFACYVAVVSYEIGVKLRADDFRYNLNMRDSPIVHTTGYAGVTPY